MEVVWFKTDFSSLGITSCCLGCFPRWYCLGSREPSIQTMWLCYVFCSRRHFESFWSDLLSRSIENVRTCSFQVWAAWPCPGTQISKGFLHLHPVSSGFIGFQCFTRHRSTQMPCLSKVRSVRPTQRQPIDDNTSVPADVRSQAVLFHSTSHQSIFWLLFNLNKSQDFRSMDFSTGLSISLTPAILPSASLHMNDHELFFPRCREHSSLKMSPPVLSLRHSPLHSLVCVSWRVHVWNWLHLQSGSLLE
jgi:hypothetical protein